MDFFWGLPTFVSSAIAGAVAALAALLLIELGFKVFGKRGSEKSKRGIAGVVITVFVIVSVQALNAYREANAKQSPEKIIENVKASNPLMATIFRVHPEAEAELLKEISMTSKLPESEQVVRFTNSSNAIINRYYSQHLLFAPNDAVFASIRHSYSALTQLENQPENCASYFLDGLKYPERVPEGFIKSEQENKAKVIEASVKMPTAPPEKVDEDQLAEKIATTYEKQGAYLNNYVKLSQIEALTPVEACNVATEFMKLLVGLPEAEGAYIIKATIVLSQQPE
ncbi:hypothetical protein [Asticcacaulis endophyticus]|uniref:Uncharacterized protein n=1 Tax=Asticcacaulis endophyticus TaxID=1395890 RepID=A0A918UXS6_9CAUL|nr:hypothetical protein [Asticcacaulis endophyticus]GGZ41502.1 hypothetical protein GCM10011273_30170 [Asticcacaulis endophyticus]